MDNKFALMNEPVTYQICHRLNQLTACYGKDVFNALVLQKRHKEYSYHLENMYCTYGYKKVLSVYKDLYLGDLNRAAG